MGKLNMAAIFLTLLFVSIAEAQVFDIGKYGGKPNSDVAQALLSAFKEACAATTPSKVVVPKGVYNLSPVKFEGPCKAAVEFQIQGTLNAVVENTPDGSWVSFNHIDHLTVNGGGIFDGQGPKSWGRCKVGTYCKSLPINLGFNFITNGIVQDITTKDSKQFHVNVLGCKEISFTRFTISAPENSPNTDGIHIGRSSGVKVLDSNIKTGDDCVSIGDGSTQITVEKVNCGPGHGFSIGSLGKYQGEEPVSGVTVKNCTLTGTTNGVRIKTWPASYEGSVTETHFEDLIMNNVGTPVLIDQVYCPWNQCNKQIPSKVKIDKVIIKNIKGTSSAPIAVKLACSTGFPCQGVEMSDIDLKFTGGAAVSECSNVQPKLAGVMNPPACSRPASTGPTL